MRLSLANIAEAAETIDPVFLHSPQIRWDSFSCRHDLDLYLKVETMNPIRSFKGRGADYFVSKLPASTTRLVAASAGNFGQGLAFAARKYGIAVDMFAAESASPVKLAAMKRFGANLHLRGHDFDQAKIEGKRFAAERGLFFVEDGREPEISEGAGTIGLELAPLNLDVLLIPLWQRRTTGWNRPLDEGQNSADQDHWGVCRGSPFDGTVLAPPVRGSDRDIDNHRRRNRSPRAD